MISRNDLLVGSAIEAGSLVAHAVNTVKMTEGFARHGLRPILVCLAPPTGPEDPERLADIYGLSEPVEWIQLSSRLANGCLRGNRWHFALSALRIGLKRKIRIFFCRSYVLPALTSRLHLPTFAEVHGDPASPNLDFRALLAATHRPAFRALVTIAPVLAQGYATRGAEIRKTLILPDAVDERLFGRPSILPPSPYGPGPNAVYAGHLYDYKGIPAILEAAGHLPRVTFHLVGGWPEDVERVQLAVKGAGLGNVVLHGLKDHRAMARFLWHADALLLPPSARHPSAAWTSPMKLGEYMMAGTPVVATDIPALRNWLSEREVIFAAPDDGASLAHAVTQAILPGAARDERVTAARNLAEGWTFTTRAARVLETLSPDTKETVDHMT